MNTQPEADALPLYELLENVPPKARLVVDDGDGMGTSVIPVGRLCHEAAAALRRLHDLLGKANALARIRAAEIESLKASLYGLYELEKQRDELEQRLTKTEAQLGCGGPLCGLPEHGGNHHPLCKQAPAQPAALSLEDSLRVTKVCCGDYANCHAPCTPRGRWQAQPAALEPLTDEQVKMLEFLYGSGEWDGVRFEERHPKEKGAFWWRKHLKRVFAAPQQKGGAA